MDTLSLNIYTSNWLITLGLVLLGTILLLFAWAMAYKWLRFLVRKTSIVVDDIFVQAAYLPGMLIILVLGVSIGLNPLIYFFPALNILKSVPYISYVFVFSLFWFCLKCIAGLEKAVITNTEAFIPANLLRLMNLNEGALHSIMRILRACIIIIFLLTLLSISGISITGILAFGGVGGIIVGFAIKDTLANFFSGLLIFWERPFVVGEWVRCPPAGIEGVVEKIGWRITQIRTFDNRPMYIPNSIFTSNYIETPQRMTSRRIREHIGIRYMDIAKLSIIMSDVKQMLSEREDINKPHARNKGPLVVFESYGEYSLIFMVDAMTNKTSWHDYNKTKGYIFFKIADIVKKHKAEFAFPTQTLQLENKPQTGETEYIRTTQ